MDSCEKLHVAVHGPTHHDTQDVLHTLIEWLDVEDLDDLEREDDMKQVPGAWTE